MSDRSRRSVLGVVGGVVLGVSAFGRPRWSGFYGGQLEARAEPDDVTSMTEVAVDLERVADVGPIREAIDRAEERRGGVSLSRDEYRTLERALAELPYYDPREHDDWHGGFDGYPVVADGTTYLLVLRPYCGRLFDVRSDELPQRDECRKR